MQMLARSQYNLTVVGASMYRIRATKVGTLRPFYGGQTHGPETIHPIHAHTRARGLPNDFTPSTSTRHSSADLFVALASEGQFRDPSLGDRFDSLAYGSPVPSGRREYKTCNRAKSDASSLEATKARRKSNPVEAFASSARE
jgi:hypothetical protein